jgi:hypothetical protein
MDDPLSRREDRVESITVEKQKAPEIALRSLFSFHPISGEH